MAAQQEPVDLRKLAKECQSQLGQIKKRALESKAGRTSQTKLLLDNVANKVDSNASSLNTWRSDLSKGRQTSDHNILGTVGRYFKQLKNAITKAEEALEQRLKLRGFWNQTRKKEATTHLSVALEKILETIKELQNQMKTVKVGSQDQISRQSRISGLRRPNRYKIFANAIGKMSQEERCRTRFGLLNFLWESFPARKPELNGKVWNPEDPGDGKIYNSSDFEEVSLILKAFYDAWSDTPTNKGSVEGESIPKAGAITSMAKICLILQNMDQQKFLDNFCSSGKVDLDLPIPKKDLAEIIPDNDAHYASIFYVEQYRAVQRPWIDGSHINIEEQEPLPLVFQKVYASGSYGTVAQYQDAYTQENYALKEHNSPETKGHLITEIERLKKLKHFHVIRFVKSYQRGNKFGVLLTPAATTDLQRLLLRYKKNDKNANGQSDRLGLREIIFTVFGCLSQGLAHIHARKIRHKDIKPSNILYERPYPNKPARFLWADFGLAYDFTNQASSKTTSESHYSIKYAAPEVMKSSDPMNTESANSERAGHQRQRSSGQGSTWELLVPSTDGRPSTRGHGRSTDVFSFGCVFLETLSYLVDKAPELEDCSPFYNHIEKVQKWAEEQIKANDDRLKVLFKLGISMVAPNPQDRPQCSEIVKQLTDASKSYFCPTCQQGSQDPGTETGTETSSIAEVASNVGEYQENAKHQKSQNGFDSDDLEELHGYTVYGEDKTSTQYNPPSHPGIHFKLSTELGNEAGLPIPKWYDGSVQNCIAEPKFGEANPVTWHKGV